MTTSKVFNENAFLRNPIATRRSDRSPTKLRKNRLRKNWDVPRSALIEAIVLTIERKSRFEVDLYRADRVRRTRSEKLFRRIDAISLSFEPDPDGQLPSQLLALIDMADAIDQDADYEFSGDEFDGWHDELERDFRDQLVPRYGIDQSLPYMLGDTVTIAHD